MILDENTNTWSPFDGRIEVEYKGLRMADLAPITVTVTGTSKPQEPDCTVEYTPVSTLVTGGYVSIRSDKIVEGQYYLTQVWKTPGDSTFLYRNAINIE